MTSPRSNRYLSGRGRGPGPVRLWRTAAGTKRAPRPSASPWPTTCGPTTSRRPCPSSRSESGLKVELTQLGEDQLSDQYNVKLNAGSTDLDVMMYRPLQEGKLFAKNGYLADLTDKVKDDKDWNWGDFQAGPVEATTYEDKVVGVPLITEQEVLYYRKDLLEKAGIAARPRPWTSSKTDAAKIRLGQPRRRRLRRPHRQVRRGHAVLELPLQLRWRLHRRRATRSAVNTRRRPSRRTRTTAASSRTTAPRTSAPT